jgi:hypothetical protein
MPHSVPFGEQEDKWFSILIFIGLPFFIIYKVFKKELPHLSEIGPKT